MLLLLVVLVPSACLLWFMNQAVKSEREAARQKLLEAYRSEINVAQQTLGGRLRQISDELEQTLNSAGPAATFALAARSNLADAIICLNTNGQPIYPQTPSAAKISTPIQVDAPVELDHSDAPALADRYAKMAKSETNIDVAAQALQVQVRSLMQGNKRSAALDTIVQAVQESKWVAGRDPEGRRILANLELLALEEFSGVASSQRTALVNDLRQQLQDYRLDSMPASQRRFLMRQAEKLLPGEVKFETLPAEDLAGSFVERTPSISAGDPGIMRSSPMPDVWQFSSPHGRVLMLYRAEHVERWLASLAVSQPSDTTLLVLAPAKNPTNALMLMPAGDPLPGWHVALMAKNATSSPAGMNQRIAAHIWIGFLVLVAIFVIGALVLGLVRRQIALTQLRNDLVANVTHELKTPLASMRLLVDTLLGSSKLNEQTTREYLQLIATENLRLSRLIDNFLTFSRIERNKYSFKFAEVPASTIVENAVASVRDRFNVPGCELKVEVAPELPPVVADGDAMVTALINLLDNAFKYTGDEKHICITAAAENGSVRFRVKDNGIGLSARDSKRIFKRFYQVDQRLSRSGSGCGLGLSIVKFIVSAHHGDIDVQSEPGKGSVFGIAIPASV